MSKAGVNAMTKSLATEWAPHGIRLNAIAPGPFPTKGAWTVSIRRLHSGAASWALNRWAALRNERTCQSRSVSYGRRLCLLTGQTIVIDGAMYLTGGNFSSLLALDEDNWDIIRSQIRESNEKDRAQRSI